jgi:hypothetical protein
MARAGAPTDTVAVGTLVEDFTLYPRHRVDNSHVADLVRALRAGHDLPPLVVERRSLRIVDGFHRARAYVSVYGPTAQASVVWRRYATDRELFEEAVAANSSHGRKLDRQDQIRVALLLEKMGATPDRIAVVLHIPEPRVEELKIRHIVVQGERQPAKPSASHVYGQTLTVEQASVLQRAPGTGLRQQVRQLLDLLRADLYDVSDTRLCDELHQLADLIKSKIPTP